MYFPFIFFEISNFKIVKSRKVCDRSDITIMILIILFFQRKYTKNVELSKPTSSHGKISKCFLLRLCDNIKLHIDFVKNCKKA